jgi:hypothetical protein
MSLKQAMSLIHVYLLAKTLIFRNEHFQLVFKMKTTPIKIRAQEKPGPLLLVYFMERTHAKDP